MKKFFEIEKAYRFEWGDLRAFAMVANVILIMIFGLTAAWVGLAIAAIGVARDLIVDRHINGLAIHLASMALNIYFLIILYK